MSFGMLTQGVKQFLRLGKWKTKIHEFSLLFFIYHRFSLIPYSHKVLPAFFHLAFPASSYLFTLSSCFLGFFFFLIYRIKNDSSPLPSNLYRGSMMQPQPSPGCVKYVYHHAEGDCQYRQKKKSTKS